MSEPACRIRARRVRPIAFVVAWVLAAPVARAQDPPAQPPPSASPREAELEERLRRLEARYESMEKRHEAVLDELKALRAESGKARAGGAGTAEAVGPSEAGSRPAAAPAGGTDAAGRTARGRDGSGASARPPRTALDVGGVGAQGTEGRTHIREYDVKPNKRPGKVTFSDGLEFGSNDDQFRLTFHNLTQVDYRAFPTSQHGTLQDQFVIPRQRWYFTGQVSRNFEFYTVVNRGYGSIDVLDAFMTINLSEILTNPSSGALTGEAEGDGDGTAEGFGAQGSGGRTDADRGKGSDARVRLRIGRMKTPYLYEYFSIAEGDLIAPERSLYAGNLADNRQVGAMFLGEILENRLGYATGLFSGNRRSFVDTNSNLDLFFYVNSRPFLKNESLPFLKYLAFGGSVNGGVEGGGLQPAIFTTANDQSAAASSATVGSVSPTFLAFNQDVRERGTRAQWAGDVAYFYKSFMLLAEYGGGFQGYTTNARSPYSTRLPFDGYMVQAAYFLTGEELTRRVNVVRPLRSLGWYKGEFGLGAVEVHARYSELDLSPRIFSDGFADPNLWANRAQAVDIGLNWYWNYYTKVQLDWQHAEFNQPITGGRDGRLLNATDLFWLRFQLFF